MGSNTKHFPEISVLNKVAVDYSYLFLESSTYSFRKKNLSNKKDS